MGTDISATVSTLARGVSEIVGSVPGAPLEGVASDVSAEAIKKIAASVEHAFDMVFGRETQASGGANQHPQRLDVSSLREINRKIDCLVEEARKHLSSSNPKHEDTRQMVQQLVQVQQLLGQLWEMQAPEYIARRLY